MRQSSGTKSGGNSGLSKYLLLQPLLRDPDSGQPLVWNGNGFIEQQSKRQFLVDNGILVLMPEYWKPDDSFRFYEGRPFDYVDWSRIEQYVEWDLRKILDKVSNSDLILDIGCGPGRVSVFLSKLGKNVIAVDYSRASLLTLVEHADIPCIQADAMTLPFHTNVADFVILTGVIHHTPNPFQSLSEACRVLRPGGQLYLKTYSKHSYYYYLYTYVGGALRALRKSRAWNRILVEKIGFMLFRLLHLIVKSGKPVERKKLVTIFENYFLKTGVTFAQREQIDAILKTSGMRVERYTVLGYMHFYVATKNRVS